MSEPLTCGYLLDPPGPSDWGGAIDEVPLPQNGVDLALANSQWKSRVEADVAARLQAGELSYWYPVEISGSQPVVPLYGGDPTQDWLEAAQVLSEQAFLSGRSRVRVIDLTRHGVGEGLSTALTHRSPERRVAFATLEPRNSSSDLLGGLDSEQAVQLLVDALRSTEDRSGRNRAASQLSLLRDLATCLSQPFSLSSIASAARYALTLDDRGGQLSSADKATLSVFNARHVKNRRSMADSLDDLEGQLQVMQAFEKKRSPLRSGTSKAQQLTIRSVGTSGGSINHELGSDLLAARLLSEMKLLDRDSRTVTIVLGCDSVAEFVLRDLMAVSAAAGSRLFLFFERFEGLPVSLLGSGGATVGGFFRLANNAEADAAADFLGKQHRFELTGTSHSKSSSLDWGWSKTTGTDRSTSRSVSTAQLFARTYQNSMSTSTSSTDSGNRGTSSTSGQDFSRVYEHILDPAVFQGLPAGSLLLVDVQSRTSALVSCAVDVHDSQVVSRRYTIALGS